MPLPCTVGAAGGRLKQPRGRGWGQPVDIVPIDVRGDVHSLWTTSGDNPRSAI
jgi:hypothetical protein